VNTSFSQILQHAVEEVPGAIAAIFAAYDGEAVDQFGISSKDDMLVLAAHYGVILNYVQSALHLFHFGEAVELILSHQRMDLVVRTVSQGYYVVLVVKKPCPLAMARRAVEAAACALRTEMV
jgi:predicted regulator of Ras-like GTPase activity (Roadblock/LC7/MglB family)